MARYKTRSYCRKWNNRGELLVRYWLKRADTKREEMGPDKMPILHKCLSFLPGDCITEYLPEPGVQLPISGISFSCKPHANFSEPVWPHGSVNFFPITCSKSFVCLNFRSLSTSFPWWVLIFFYKGRKKRRAFLITRSIPTHATGILNIKQQVKRGKAYNLSYKNHFWLGQMPNWTGH